MPALHATACRGPDGPMCLSQSDAKALWLWIEAERRALEMATTCLAQSPSAGSNAPGATPGQ